MRTKDKLTKNISPDVLENMLEEKQKRDDADTEEEEL